MDYLTTHWLPMVDQLILEARRQGIVEVTGNPLVLARQSFTSAAGDPVKALRTFREKWEEKVLFEQIDLYRLYVYRFILLFHWCVPLF